MAPGYEAPGEPGRRDDVVGEAEARPPGRNARIGDQPAAHEVEQAVPGQAYPPILIATTRRDDRVHPGHARKMTAKLRAMGYDQVYFYEPAAGGHGYGKDNKERAAFSALGYTFLRRKIGWS